VIKTSAANINADSSLVQSAEFVDGKPVKLRIPDKIAAAKELIKVCGWAKPDRLELAATDTLGDFIQSIRKGPGAVGRRELPNPPSGLQRSAVNSLPANWSNWRLPRGNLGLRRGRKGRWPMVLQDQHRKLARHKRNHDFHTLAANPVAARVLRLLCFTSASIRHKRGCTMPAGGRHC
jgi:hypothetical protein